MSNATAKKSLDVIKNIILTTDLSFVINRLIAEKGWNHDEALTVIQQYQRYLFLKRKYPEYDLPPSKEIDEAWHAHILHTEEYRHFCENVFFDFEEKYLHHSPKSEADHALMEKQFALTQELYYQEFGEYLYQIIGDTFIQKWFSRFSRKLMAKVQLQKTLSFQKTE